MGGTDDFYTLKGYARNEAAPLSAAMEDYLEMILRLEAQGQRPRITQIAQHLHVKPSSASKMAANLQAAGYLKKTHYESLEVTELGRREGAYLLHRHGVLNRFFELLNHSGHQLPLVEKIEHFMDRQTVENLEHLTRSMAEGQNAEPS